MTYQQHPGFRVDVFRGEHVGRGAGVREVDPQRLSVLNAV
jgi:hypothetical protein